MRADVVLRSEGSEAGVGEARVEGDRGGKTAGTVGRWGRTLLVGGEGLKLEVGRFGAGRISGSDARRPATRRPPTEARVNSSICACTSA